MEDGELFEGLGADFLAGGTEDASFEDAPGFDPITGEVFGDEKKETTEPGKEPELENELSFVNEETTEVPGSGDEGQQDNENIDEDTPDSEESPSSPITSLTSALREDGVLSSLTDEEFANIKSGGDLMAVIKQQIEKNEYADLTDNQKEYLEAARSGVPEQEYRQAKRTADQLSKISLESLDGDEAADNRKQILVQDFLSKGFDQEDSEKYAGRSVDLGEDVEDAKKALGRMKEEAATKAASLITTAKANQVKDQEAYNTQLNALKVQVNSVKEILPNVKVNEETHGKIFDLMTKTAGYDKGNNPVNAVVKNMLDSQDYRIKLNYLHVLTDGFKNFDSLTGTVGSSAVNKLDAALAAQDAKIKSGHSEKSTGKAKTTGLMNALNNMGL